MAGHNNLYCDDLHTKELKLFVLKTRFMVSNLFKTFLDTVDLLQIRDINNYIKTENLSKLMFLMPNILFAILFYYLTT